MHDANEWLVLHKPAGWHSVAQRRSDVGGPATVEEWLHRNVPGQDKLEEAGLCNRLDLVTSGCILAAKNARTHGVLCRALKRDDIRKYYLALVAGTLQTGQGSFKLCFTGRYRRSKKVSVSESGPQRSQGSCAWRVLARDLIALPALAASTRHGCPRDANASIRVSLIQVELLGAGQRHQIRADASTHPLMERLCQPVGAAEVVEDSWMRDSDLLCDALKGEGAESFGDEQVLGRVQDL